MDPSIQATEEDHPVGDAVSAGGIAQSRARKKGSRGRPKKVVPLSPVLAQELVITLRHFLPELAQWLGAVTDARDPEQLVFPLKVLLLLGMVMFLTHSGSRNHFNDNARYSMEMARTIARILGCEVESVPHLDTLEKVLRQVAPCELEQLHAQLVRRLIRMKALDDGRIGGRFLLAIDGTGLYSFPERHCDYCIKTEHKSGKITYSHKVLVAFIVSESGFALPVACEFIENPGPTYNKQDCEKKAFHRMQAAIKRMFPQTGFWLLLDALYADQYVIGECEHNEWNYAITFLDTDMPALWAEAQKLLGLSPAQQTTLTLPEKQGTRLIRWINGLNHQGHSLSAIFQEDRKPDGTVICSFAHLVGREIHAGNALTVASASRQRWRCENEGFNVLKNGGFALEHVYSRNPVASKCYFFLMLTAHLIQQLLTRGRLGAVFRTVFGSFLTYGKNLLQSLNHHPIPPDLPMPGQIRFCSSA